MGLVLRVLYNNQNWQAPCERPGKDMGCWLCFKDSNLQIRQPERDDKVCSGHCWERYLCRKYNWGCNPPGRVFGSRAIPGAKAFFVFKQPDGKYTLWGRSIVSSVDDEPRQEGEEGEIGFAFIHFEPFEPMPREEWVENLEDTQLVGEQWLMGRYRYIDSQQEGYLEQLVEGLVPEKTKQSPVIASKPNSVDSNISIMPNIYKKLERVASEEGRQVDEIVREAVAEWLRERSKG